MSFKPSSPIDQQGLIGRFPVELRREPWPPTHPHLVTAECDTLFHSVRLSEMFIFGLRALAVGMVAYLLFGAHEAGEDREAFQERHHCISIGEQAGNQQGGWHCDDREIHDRWRQQR
jgi:hypothetical protein